MVNGNVELGRAAACSGEWAQHFLARWANLPEGLSILLALISFFFFN